MQVLVVGEGMFEYRTNGAGSAAAFGGDCLNTSVHLARQDIPVQFVTAIGRDGLSEWLCAQWQREGVDTRHVLRHPTRQPGIYAIENDPDGERSFLYWRAHSAAREMFALDGIAAATSAAVQADLLFFSLISLAILPEDGRESLLGIAAERRRRGRSVAFDGNYRPSLWASPAQAQHWCVRACAVANIGLPTLSDELALWQEECTAEHAIRDWLQRGCTEVALKAGAYGCVLSDSEYAQHLAPARRIAVVDSSGAGDAFNAGYLAARLRGAAAEPAGRRGQALAEWVIQRHGAVPAIDALAPYATTAPEHYSGDRLQSVD